MELDERMYEFNRKISLMFVTGIRKPRQQDMMDINFEIGEWIKEYRKEKVRK